MTDLQQPQKRSLLGRLPIVLAMLPALIPCYLIYRNGVNMPYWDEWDHGFVDMAIKAYYGSVSWADLVAPHNEHRVIIPKLIYLVLTWLTSWNEFALMYFGWFVAVVTSIFVGVLCFKTALNRTRAAIGWFLCNLLIFSPAQWENWLAGYGMINFLPMMFITAGFVVLSRNTGFSHVGETVDSTQSAFRSDWIQIVVLIFLATAATYSSLQGFLAWPILGIALLWRDAILRSNNRIRMLVVWTGAFGFNILFYLIGYQRDISAEQPHEPMSLLGKIKFGLAYLGNPFFINSLDKLGYAIVVGAMLLTLTIAACAIAIFVWRKNRDWARAAQYLIWFLLAGFTLATALLAVVFRSSVGMQMALAGRYVTSTIYLPIALINLLPMLWEDFQRHCAIPPWRPVQIFLAITALFFFTVYLVSFKWSWNNAEVEAQVRRQGKAGLLLINVLPDNPQLQEALYSNPHQMIPLARQLDEINYLHPRLFNEADASRFRDPTPPPTPQGIFGQFVTIEAEGPGRLVSSGWAFLPLRTKPADAIVLTYDNDRGQPIIFTLGVMGADTPEIARAYDNDHYQKCGWEARFSASSIPNTLQRIRLSAWAMDLETGFLYQLDRNLVVTR